ncbi:LysR family transcriptional regulator [Gymnodinialimonas hymeniacidonis]|uniref:LysR family transcriptional regulator n=1 Tax=Gymnodinialimonas hymeniacidonis TaxID=3126508 RepID=UPI0034C6D835
MTIRLLKTLVAVADTKTFSAAAEAVHVTHAAVSQQMRTLEDDLGLTLFDRSKRTPTLTAAGQQVVERARRLIADYDGLVDAVLSEDGLSGTFKLGVLRTTLTGLTPKAMAILKTRFPEVGLHLRTGLTSALLADLQRGDLDAAITSKPHLLPKGLAFHDLAHEPLELIASPDEQHDDPLTLLANRPYIRFNRNAVVGTLIDNWIVSQGVDVHETMELDSPEAITSMVHANLGVSILPRLAVPPAEAAPVKRLRLGPDAPERVVGLAHAVPPLKAKAIQEVLSALTHVIGTAHDA